MLKVRKHKHVGESVPNSHSEDRLKIWISSNGRRQAIADMDINYIKNAIAKVERGELESRRSLLPILKNELIKRINERYK